MLLFPCSHLHTLERPGGETFTSLNGEIRDPASWQPEDGRTSWAMSQKSSQSQELVQVVPLNNRTTSTRGFTQKQPQRSLKEALERPRKCFPRPLRMLLHAGRVGTAHQSPGKEKGTGPNAM